jgi:hypothetical protein
LIIQDSWPLNAAIHGKSWIKSSIAGLVSEVKVTSVTAKGVTLEIVLIEAEVKRDVP